MKRLFILIILLLAAGVSAADTLLKTGDKLTRLPSPLYLDGSEKEFSGFLGKTDFVVLHIWEMNNAALGEFYSLSQVAAQLQNRVQFVGIGIGAHIDLKRFPGAARLGFPVNSDHHGAIRQVLLRPKDNLPLTVILDKQGTILWRGPFRQMMPVLRKCLKGKFDLAEEIRVENFAAAVNEAVKAGDLEKAIQMIAAEYRKHPGKTDLLNAQAALYVKMNRRQDAYKMLLEAEKNSPGNYRIFEIEYQLIGSHEDVERLPDFFSRLKKNFSGRPDILIAFALAECKLPPDKLQLKYVLDLAETGWQSGNFKNKEQRGLYALDYAMILHSIGRNDLAVKVVRFACENLKNGSKEQKRAQEALLYYTKLHEIAPSAKEPDLKK